MSTKSDTFWNCDGETLLEDLQSAATGLTTLEAVERLKRYGANLLRPGKRTDILTLLIAQFKSPIILILLAAAILSYFLHDNTDAVIIIAIVLISGLLGLWQEKGAANLVGKLLSIVQTKATVVRDGSAKEIAVADVVPGDIVVLSAGSVVPGDCLLLELNDLFVDEAALTGESYPVDKVIGPVPVDASLAKRVNTLFMGTHVISGSGRAVVVNTGRQTEFGRISEQLRLRPPETDFERGIRRFGYLLMEVTLLLVIIIFAFNVYFRRPILDSFMFALALAVGLTPQLLPAIITINLARGSKKLADKKVIVRRLASLENFGSMNVLCADKTGTLTEGVVKVLSAVDAYGDPSDKAMLYAYVNAAMESGFTNPIDSAIKSLGQFDIQRFEKLDEIPYDFIRKRLSVMVADGGVNLLLTKGALNSVLSVCTKVESRDRESIDLNMMRASIDKLYQDYSAQGYRTIGIAYRNLGEASKIDKADEAEMTFLGILVLHDPPKTGVAGTLKELRDLGVDVKIITGDNELVAGNVSRQAGMENPEIVTGADLRAMTDEALTLLVHDIDVFAEVEPNQKERIILALKKSGRVVGFLGDGINDASALHAADVGISVNTAVDVAKAAADIVLLETGLEVLIQGVREGRRTFANTMKYVFMATSANFGNMFSMAGASLFMSFLPLLPKQILLTNLLTDFPEMTVATDNVDPEMVERPQRWNLRFIRNFMLTFGLLSSIFDYLTFGVLLLVLHAGTDQFRAGWFMESVVSAAIIVLVVRTRRGFLRSRPGKYLLITTLVLVAITIAFPYTYLGKIFGFAPLPVPFLLMMGGIVLLYIVSAEVTKAAFYRKMRD